MPSDPIVIFTVTSRNVHLRVSTWKCKLIYKEFLGKAITPAPIPTLSLCQSVGATLGPVGAMALTNLFLK
jgi:hypothetical protein